MSLTEVIEVDGSAPVVLYRFYDEGGALLYVGITGDPAGRFAAHAKDKPWWPEVARKTAVLCASREVALEAERTAVRDERPVHNVLLQVLATAPIPAQADVQSPCTPVADDDWLSPRARLAIERNAAARRQAQIDLQLAYDENGRLRDHVDALIRALAMTQHELQRARCLHAKGVILDGECKRCGEQAQQEAV